MVIDTTYLTEKEVLEKILKNIQREMKMQDID